MTLLYSLVEAHPTHIRLETALNLGRTAMEVVHLCFMLQFSLNLGLPLKVAAELFLDPLCAVVLLHEVSFSFFGCLAQLHLRLLTLETRTI